MQHNDNVRKLHDTAGKLHDTAGYVIKLNE